MSVRDTSPRYCCFGCALAAQVAGRGGEEGEARWILARLMLSGFLAMNVMLLSFTLYSIDVYDLQVTSRMQAFFYTACRWVMLACSLGVLVLLGIPAVRYALTELRGGRFTADIFILTGVAAAWTLSVQHTLAAAGAVYFETAAMLLVLLTLGRFLEARARASSGAAMVDLLAGAPDTAVRYHNGGEETVPVAALQVGDRVLLRSGDGVPVDGTVEDGAADVDEASLTGEAHPVPKQVGDSLYAGTVNLNGRLVMRTTAVGADRALARVARLLETARAEETPAQRLADRAAAVLLPVTLALAGSVLGYWWWRVDLGTAILHALAVLVIACPCALGIATPLALWIALREAVRHGIVARSAAAIETLGRVDTVLVDKTGTLTTGDVAGCTIHALEGADEADALAAAAAVASGSTHPVARALRVEAERRGLARMRCDDFVQEPGRGMQARLGDGRAVRVGSRAWLQQHGVTGDWQGAPDAATWIAVDARAVGAIMTHDALRPDAADALFHLRALGLRIELLTGDRRARAEMLARELDIPVTGEMLPEDKAAHVRALRDAGRRVAMVGDGINDAAALATADVGIAMGCGADLAREAAHMSLVHDRLEAVAWVIGYARRARRAVRGNLVWALAYNAVGLPVAAAGLLNPIVAALAMVGSSLLVLANSLRLRTWRADGAGEGGGARAVPVATTPGLPGSASA